MSASALLQSARHMSAECCTGVGNGRRSPHPPGAKSGVQDGGGSWGRQELGGHSFQLDRAAHTGWFRPTPCREADDSVPGVV